MTGVVVEDVQSPQTSEVVVDATGVVVDDDVQSPQTSEVVEDVVVVVVVVVVFQSPQTSLRVTLGNGRKGYGPSVVAAAAASLV